jgi:hypothetical protein
MGKRCVIGLLVTNRVENVPQLQKVLTECGCHIRTRLGLHDTDAASCSPSGLILLELFGEEKVYAEVEEMLRSVTGLQIQKMVFET